MTSTVVISIHLNWLVKHVNFFIAKPPEEYSVMYFKHILFISVYLHIRKLLQQADNVINDLLM